MYSNETERKKEIIQEYISRSRQLFLEKKTYHGWKQDIYDVEAETFLFFRRKDSSQDAKRLRGMLETCTRANSLWLVGLNGKGAESWTENNPGLIAQINTALQQS